MGRNTWHILRDEGSVTVTRVLPVRFDVCAETTLPAGRVLKVAQQVRQDLWRKLQKLRGFSPVVCVVQAGTGLRVTAGGRIEATFHKPTVDALIAEVLADPRNRARWSNYARAAGQV
ncbi:hypothetical protein NBRC116601_12710 [Cognatishimia sp. WU-CL00825]|uniref:hypothetical protein n=1 Tax=Cognatishimia sp. WU-CL00825 TaxID=3127658 RepID=UPI003109A3EC